MKKSVSNIAWEAERDAAMYAALADMGYQGLEIAPTRIFPHAPYCQLQEAGEWARELKGEYGLTVCSMQSIWFGRQERIFGSEAERLALLDYTKQAIAFAQAVGCGNLVFGCPRNRAVPEGMTAEEAAGIAIPFFKELGHFAWEHGTVLSMEANPPIYNTNYINGTAEALKLVEQVDDPGFLLNLDLGTMVYNREPVSILQKQGKKINHVHISEPGLVSIVHRQLHGQLQELLEKEGYCGYVSVEMGKQCGMEAVSEALTYVGGSF